GSGRDPRRRVRCDRSWRYPVVRCETPRAVEGSRERFSASPPRERGPRCRLLLPKPFNHGEHPMAQSYEEMDAIAMLKADHRKVEELFEKFEKTNGKATKQGLAEQICLELKVHTAIEEEIFYPACRGKIEDDLVDEAYVEHDAAKVLIAVIEAGGPDEAFYDAQVKVLSEM